MKARFNRIWISEKNINQLAIWMMVITGLFATFDIFNDLNEGAEWSHVAVEVILTLLIFFSVSLLWRRNFLLDQKVKFQKGLVTQSEALRSLADADAKRWRDEASKLITGLSDAIDAQLDRWHLTAAEKEVTLLLLKGLSLKDVAEVRGVSEKTARAQSFSVYAKSGLAGRAELSAFFLEDLMVPLASNRKEIFL